MTALHIAAMEGHVTAVDLLLASPRVHVGAVDGTGCTPLHIAAGTGKSDVVVRLASDPRVDVNAAASGLILGGNELCTPLQVAALLGQSATVSALLADPRVIVHDSDPVSPSALLLAAHQGHAAVVSLLLGARGSDPNASCEALGGLAPLTAAAVRGHAAVVAILLADPRVDMAARGGNGLNALGLARKEGHAAVVSLLEGGRLRRS